MSLATRCPNCNTIFQVNEEQLKRYSGVVRCGVCSNPFNGIDHLIGRLSQTDTSPSSANVEKSASVTAANETKPGVPTVWESPHINTIHPNLQSCSEKISDDTDNTIESDVIKSKEAAMKAAFEKQIQSIDFDLNLSSLNEERPASYVAFSGSPANDDAKVVEREKAQVESDKREPFLSSDTLKDNAMSGIIVDAPEKITDKPASTEDLVKIVQKKKKRSLFSQILWGTGTFFLLILLGIQGIYRYSEEIIAWWPPAEELVNTTCERLSCPVEAPIPTPPLTVEANVPEKLENMPDQYSQIVTITNHRPDLQIWPALVMELMDSDNKVLLRRIFQPEEYLPEEAGTAKGLQPLSGISFKMTFEFAHHSAVKNRISLLNNP